MMRRLKPQVNLLAGGWNQHDVSKLREGVQVDHSDFDGFFLITAGPMKGKLVNKAYMEEVAESVTSTNPNGNTQCGRLLAYLRSGKKITQLQAWGELGISRLASRVNDLKKAGFLIHDEWIDVTNRFNEQVRVKRYYL